MEIRVFCHVRFRIDIVIIAGYRTVASRSERTTESHLMEKSNPAVVVNSHNEIVGAVVIEWPVELDGVPSVNARYRPFS